MLFRVLGPLRVWNGAAWSTIGAAQHRVILGVLLAEAGRVVSTDRLIDELWGEQQPRRATATVHVYVGRLRRLLGGTSSPLATRDGGYVLVTKNGDVDADVFEQQLAAGRKAAAAGQLETAFERFAAAMRLWHGQTLADVPASHTINAYVNRLEQARLSALEDRIGIQLELGHHGQVVEELGQLVAEHPLRERLHANYMRALYHCGRRAEALAAYQNARHILLEELGLEPSPELRGIQQAILSDPPSVPAVVTVVPAQLPAGVPDFTGRTLQLKQLDNLLGRYEDVVVISTVAGAAGVGKTALALRWAHTHREQFPDGQLYVNLRGYDTAQPLRPIDALTRFLRTMGVPPEQVPADEEEAAAMYRSLLAGRRMLVLLDNARHPDQIRPLLPSHPGCLALVTSRDRLDGLVARDGAVRVQLDVLTAGEAQTLLARLIDAERINHEPEATAELARLCGYLPLALRIAAANLTARPHWTIVDYVGRLGTGDRLAALDVNGDPHTGIRAAFDLSYASLTPDLQRLFRRVGLVPGPDTTAAAAAALCEIAPDEASRLLDQLCAVNLVAEHAPGRYAMHDLLRRYAAHKAATTDGTDLTRLYDYYLHTVDAAAKVLSPEIVRLPIPDPSAGTGFSSDTDAMAWMDAERAGLTAAVVAAARHGPHQSAWRLADALRGYLHISLSNVDWQIVAQAGLAAATAEGDQLGQASAHLSLAMLDHVSNRHQPATEHYESALRFTGGWPEGEAAALGNLGSLHWAQGRLETAHDLYVKAVAIDRSTGWPGGRAPKLANLCQVQLARGLLAQALEYGAQSVAVFRELGARTGLAASLARLGETYHALGQLDQALAHLDQALALHGELGSRGVEANPLRLIAAVHRDAGRYEQARELATSAVTRAEESGLDRIHADALVVLASIDHRTGDNERAIRAYERAFYLANTTGYRGAEASALTGLAMARSDPDPGLQALTMARQYGYRLCETEALTALATILCHQGKFGQALGYADQARAIRNDTGQIHSGLAALGCAHACYLRGGPI